MNCDGGVAARDRSSPEKDNIGLLDGSNVFSCKDLDACTSRTKVEENSPQSFRALFTTDAGNESLWQRFICGMYVGSQSSGSMGFPFYVV